MSHHKVAKGLLNKIIALIRLHWKFIAVFAMITLLIAALLYYWSHYREQSQTVRSSLTFERLVTAVNSDESGSIKQLIDFSNNDNSHYAVLAALKAAQFYVVERKDYNGAITLLSNGLAKAKNEVLKDIILIRIARLQRQLDLNDQCLITLSKVKNSGWTAIVNTIRGDVLMSKHCYDESIAAYRTALSSNPAPDLKRNIAMKLNHALYLKKTVDK